MDEFKTHYKQVDKYLLNNPIVDTKRYKRHKDSCRQFLSEWVCDTFTLCDASKLTRHEHLVDINDGLNEPLRKAISMELYFYYENLLRKHLASDSYPQVTTCVAYKIPATFSSVVESFMIKTLEDKKDRIKSSLEDRLDNIMNDKVFSNSEKTSFRKTIRLYDTVNTFYTNEANVTIVISFLSSVISNYFEYFTGAIFDHEPTKAKKIFFKNYSFTQIIDNCFDKMFYLYVTNKWCSDITINENNYTTFTKFTREMCESFLVNLIQICKYELESAWADLFYLASNSEEIRKQLNEVKELKEKHEKEYNERKQNEPDLLLQNQQLESQLKIEKDSKASLEKSLLENIANLNKINKENQNTINELTTQYDDMITYYESIIASMNSANIEEPTIINIDKYKKYIFVAANKIKNEAIYNILLTEFPNSKVIYSDFNLVSDSDLVVFLTAILDHSTYFMIKNQCISKNIPYIHCHKRNINDIKAEISKFS